MEKRTIGSRFEVEYDELADNNYIITNYDEKLDMRYEYFYDGESYYLIDNLSNPDGYLYKWNGKWESEYNIQDIQYILLDWPYSNLTWKEE